MAATTQGHDNSALDGQSDREPAVFSAAAPNLLERPALERPAEIARRKPRQRVSVGELKLDLSSRILFCLMVVCCMF
jgi:hypothetical protein